MSFQSVFKRYELKFMLSFPQKEKLLRAMESYMQPDIYGKTNVRNIYFDTNNFLLIRRSIEKPLYKEKLRIRSYGRADLNTRVFVEIKKKFKGIVYKRRISMLEKDALNWLSGREKYDVQSQISKEIDYFRSIYEGLSPKVFLSYDREAYLSRDGSDLRVTFDDNILCRQAELSLDSDSYGESILDEGKVLMEVKCSGGIPLWLTKILSEQKIYKTSFSKYGTAYKTLILPYLDEYNTKNEGEAHNA